MCCITRMWAYTAIQSTSSICDEVNTRDERRLNVLFSREVQNNRKKQKVFFLECDFPMTKKKNWWWINPNINPRVYGSIQTSIHGPLSGSIHGSTDVDVLTGYKRA